MLGKNQEARESALEGLLLHHFLDCYCLFRIQVQQRDRHSAKADQQYCLRICGSQEKDFWVSIREYAEQAAKSLEEAKNKYFPSQEQPTIKPFEHLEKPKDVPHHQTTPPTVDKTMPNVDKAKHTIEDGV